MVSFTTLFVGFATAASFVAASPRGPRGPRPQATCPTTSCGTSNEEVLKITNFFSRKPEGVNISTLAFTILDTVGLGLNLTCVPYDPVTNRATSNFEDKHVYSCAQNTNFSFSFENAADKLYLWHSIVTNTNTLIGNATIPNNCRAGGNGLNDKVCQQVADVNITMIRTA